MAAPSFIAKSTAQASTAATFGVNYMGSIVAGDMLYLQVVSKGNGTSTPAGWTAIGTGFFYNNAPTLVGAGNLYRKIADGTETGSLTITRTGAVAGIEFSMAQMYQFRGTNNLTSGGGNTNQLGDGSTTVTWNPINISGSEATAIAFVGMLTSSTPGTPAGYTESATDNINAGPVSASLECNTKENATTSGSITASGGYTGGWITFHSYTYEVRGRSFIINSW